MFDILLFALLTTLFLLFAVLFADGVLRRAPPKQDIVWRVTLIALAALPLALMGRHYLPRFTVVIPIGMNSTETPGSSDVSGLGDHTTALTNSDTSNASSRAESSTARQVTLQLDETLLRNSRRNQSTSSLNDS